MAILDRLPNSQPNRLPFRERMRNFVGFRGLQAADVQPPITALKEVTEAIAHPGDQLSEADTQEMVYELDEYAEQVRLQLEQEGAIKRREEVSLSQFGIIAKAWDASRTGAAKEKPTENVDALMEFAMSRIGGLAASQTFTTVYNRAVRNPETAFYDELDRYNDEMRGIEKTLEKVG